MQSTVLLTQLAVATSAQGQGIGMGLLQDAIRRTLFYQRFGFR